MSNIMEKLELTAQSMYCKKVEELTPSELHLSLGKAVMGEIAGRLSDFTVITSDNPRTEDPDKIVSMIEDGIKRTNGKYNVIVNRREAIAWALDFAQKDDVIILAGKGQETYQIIGREKHDFDERVVVYSALNAKRNR